MANEIPRAACVIVETLSDFRVGLRRPQLDDAIRVWQLDLGWLTILWTGHSTIQLLSLSRALGLQEGIAQERERLNGLNEGV